MAFYLKSIRTGEISQIHRSEPRLPNVSNGVQIKMGVSGVLEVDWPAGSYWINGSRRLFLTSAKPTPSRRQTGRLMLKTPVSR